jgi:hypothetical protein
MTKRILWLWPFVLIIGGALLLLGNFKLLDLDVSSYWPVVLVLLGIQLLARGDIGLGWSDHTFGITRGSVQSASLEIESGELDVQIRALRKPGRLIAGQYTARSRPALTVRNNHATLRMQRGHTWWMSLADWDLGIAQDLPWEILVSAFLGRLDADLRGLTIARAYIASGLGHVSVACPLHADGPIYARSTLGDVRVSIPDRSLAIITVKTGPFGHPRVNSRRFREVTPGVYTNMPEGESGEQPNLEVTASTVFGSVSIG